MTIKAMSEIEYIAADSTMISMSELKSALVDPPKRADAFWTCTMRYVVRMAAIMMLPVGKMEFISDYSSAFLL